MYAPPAWMRQWLKANRDAVEAEFEAQEWYWREVAMVLARIATRKAER